MPYNSQNLIKGLNYYHCNKESVFYMYVYLKQFPFPRDSSLATSWQSSRLMLLIGSLSWIKEICTQRILVTT